MLLHGGARPAGLDTGFYVEPTAFAQVDMSMRIAREEITGLVNAAIFSVVPMSRAPFDEITLDEWDLMMRVNVRGPWQASKAVVPAMRAAGYGKIVNISSGTALKGSDSRIHT